MDGIDYLAASNKFQVPLKLSMLMNDSQKNLTV